VGCPGGHPHHQPRRRPRHPPWRAGGAPRAGRLLSGEVPDQGHRGLRPPRAVRSAAHARVAGGSPHAVRLIATAQELATQGEEYGRLLSHLGTLGYRGHPITKSRAYSVTFGQIRRARRRYRSNPAGLAPDADIRQLLDDDHDVPDGFELVSSWIFHGQGYLDVDQAAAAVESAARARTRSVDRPEVGNHPEEQS
jgi:hypothetical protein